jgi:hypothetical protein
LSELEIQYDVLNVGKTLTCLLHSFRTETPCVLVSPIPPFNLDVRYSDYDFSWLGIDNPTPLQIWDRLCFLLSMSGILLFPNNIAGYRKENENFIIMTNYNKKINIKYNKINVFDEQETGWNYVYDFYNWKSGGIHGVNQIADSDSNFVKSIKFYPSERDNVSSSVKDLVAISYLSSEEITNQENSHIYSRLKVLRMLSDNDIKGNIVGYTSTGKSKHRKPVIEFEKRVKIPHYVPEISFKDVYEMDQKKGYTWKLLEKIIRHTST